MGIEGRVNEDDFGIRNECSVAEADVVINSLQVSEIAAEEHKQDTAEFV